MVWRTRSRGSRRIVDFENYDHAPVSTGGGSRWWARQKKSSTRIAEWKRRLSLAKWKPWSVRKRRVWVGITMGTMDTGESLHADEMQRHSSRWCALGTKIFRLDSTEGTLPDVGSREQGNFLETFLLFFPLLPSSILYAFYVPRVNLEYRLIIEFTRRIVLNGFYRKKKKFDEIKN